MFLSVITLEITNKPFSDTQKEKYLHICQSLTSELKESLFCGAQNPLAPSVVFWKKKNSQRYSLYRNVNIPVTMCCKPRSRHFGGQKRNSRGRNIWMRSLGRATSIKRADELEGLSRYFSESELHSAIFLTCYPDTKYCGNISIISENIRLRHGEGWLSRRHRALGLDPTQSSKSHIISQATDPKRSRDLDLSWR